MTYLYLEHANSALTSNALYTKHTNREKWFTFKLQRVKLSKVFESLPDSVAATLGIMKLDPPTKAVVTLDEQEQIVESRRLPETLVCLLINKKDAVFAASPFWFRYSGRINITISRSKASISVTLLQLDKRQRLLTSSA